MNLQPIPGDKIGEVLNTLPLETMTLAEIDAALKNQLPGIRTLTIDEWEAETAVENARLEHQAKVAARERLSTPSGIKKT